MKRQIHAGASLLSALFLATFWTSTLFTELFRSAAAVVEVKQLIAWALIVFVPLMLLTAGTGFSMGAGKHHPLLKLKRRRTPFIGLNGALILVPSALFLAMRATAGQFDSLFYSVQMLELLAGATNLTLIGLNIRDGLTLSRLHRAVPVAK
ncbi:hypothetical protein [Duffyella gerundensis]|uniref:hypothetical protein n=1 Tax=Duffyella gerundensis TaxID=1619313 RepID=UPI001654812F|nr:hypothetical protein [Duffyella gerundensis]